MPMGQAGGASAMMGGDMAQMRDMMQMMRGGMMPMGMGMAGGRPFQHIEGQIAFYKTELKITDAQEPLWNAFADALRANASHLQQAVAKATEAKEAVAVPEQMERRIALLTVLLDTMQSMQAAAKPLYAALTDEQKGRRRADGRALDGHASEGTLKTQDPQRPHLTPWWCSVRRMGADQCRH